MANKPLKSITFPGLTDTYTIPQVDSTLTVSGDAADAKAVGDQLTDLKADLNVLKTSEYNPFTFDYDGVVWHQGIISSGGVYDNNAQYGSYTDKMYAIPGAQISYIGGLTDISVSLCQWFTDGTFLRELLQVGSTGRRYTKVLPDNIDKIAFTEFYGSSSGIIWTPADAQGDFNITVKSELDIKINDIDNQLNELTNNMPTYDPIAQVFENTVWHQGIISGSGVYDNNATYGSYTNKMRIAPGTQIDYIGGLTDISVSLCQWFADGTFSRELLQVGSNSKRYTKVLPDNIDKIAFTEFYGSSSGVTWTPADAENDFKISVQTELETDVAAIATEIDSYEYAERIRNYTLKNMDEWRSLGMGLFIHWGVYSVLAGFYDGNYYTHYAGIGAAEWIFRRAKIPQETYKAYQSSLTGENWDAENIAKLAYDAGMKYVVITAKHHEGFVMYDSAYAEWNTETAPIRNTVLDELKTACEKYGLKFGVYFSQNYDWSSTGGFGQEFKTQDGTDPYTSAQHTAYVANQCNILKEIMDRYNPYILWYDIPNPVDSYFTPILDLQHSYYPAVVCNDRLAATYYGDYGVGEDNYFMGIRGGDREYAEACRTINRMWGYDRGKDLGEGGVTQVLDTWIDTLKQRILETLPRGQNLLMNISPKADGSISPHQIRILTCITDFSEKYGTFFNTSAVSKTVMPNWGRMLKTDDNILRCYIFRTTVTTCRIDGVLNRYAKRAYYYNANGERISCTLEKLTDDTMNVTGYTFIDTTATEGDTYGISRLAVVEIEFDNNIVGTDTNYFANGDIIYALAFNGHGYNIVLAALAGNYPYLGTPSNNWTSENYLETEFVYTGTTGSYSLAFHMHEATTDTFTVTITGNDNTTQTKTVTMSAETDKTATDVTLTNGNRYKLKITKSSNKAFKFISVTIS